MEVPEVNSLELIEEENPMLAEVMLDKEALQMALG